MRVTGTNAPQMAVAHVQVEYQDLVEGQAAEALADATATTTDLSAI